MNKIKQLISNAEEYLQNYQLNPTVYPLPISNRTDIEKQKEKIRKRNEKWNKI